MAMPLEFLRAPLNVSFDRSHSKDKNMQQLKVLQRPARLEDARRRRKLFGTLISPFFLIPVLDTGMRAAQRPAAREAVLSAQGLGLAGFPVTSTGIEEIKQAAAGGPNFNRPQEGIGGLQSLLLPHPCARHRDESSARVCGAGRALSAQGLGLAGFL